VFASLEQCARPVVSLALGDAVGVNQHQGVKSLIQFLLQTCQSPQAGVTCLALPRPRHVIIETLEVVEVVSCDILLLNWCIHFDFLILVEVEPPRCWLLLLARRADMLRTWHTAFTIEEKLIGEGLIQTLHLLDWEVGEVGLVFDACSVWLRLQPEFYLRHFIITSYALYS
jgi:hypothetical protein